MSNDLRFIKNTIYALKRDYGQPLELIWRTASTTDPETGKKTVTTDSLHLNRVIVLPSKIDRQFIYDLTFIASNKNFTYGGFFDATNRRLLVDREDLPAGFQIENGQYVVFSGRRYEVQSVAEFEDAAVFGVVVKQVVNIDLENLIKRQIHQFIPLQQTLEVTVE